jgi:site-specific DNA recombinase
MRAVIYTRTGAGNGENAGRQLERCREVAAERGWEVIATCADQGTSAWNMNRPGLNAAMSLVRDCGCDILIAYEFSVLTRRASDLESILGDAEAAGVTVHLVTESLDSSDAASRLALRIAGSL